MDYPEVIDASTALVPQRRLDQSPPAVYIGSVAKGSRRSVIQRLKVVTRMVAGHEDIYAFPFESLRYQHTALIRSELASGEYSTATANAIISALRGVLKECWRLGLMSVEEAERARDIKVIRGSKKTTGRALSTAEIKGLLGCCEDTPTGKRDAALLAVLISAGLRRSEAAALELRDYDVADQTVLVRSGKGNKSRQCPLADFAIARLDAYIKERGADAGPLFVRAVRGDHLATAGLTDQAVRHVLNKRCEKAGIPTIAPHSLRRTFITSLLTAGVDAMTVSKMAGHSSVNTTMAYDRRGDDVKKKAVKNLDVGL